MNTIIERHLTWLTLKKHRAPRTIMDRRRILGHADRHLPYGLRATEDELATYLYDNTWSKWTRHCYDSALRVFYTWGVTKGILTLNPMADIDKPPAGDRIPRPWTDEEIHTILTRAPRWPWRRAAFLAVYAGLRVSEIATVTYADIVRGRLRVRGKGDKIRVVPICGPLAEELDDGRPWQYDDGTWRHLCVGGRGPVKGATMSQHQRRVWDALRLPSHVTLHGGRHAFATALRERGVDSRDIQVLMGHESLQTTQGYMLVANHSLDRAVNLLPRWDIGPAAIRPEARCIAAA